MVRPTFIAVCGPVLACAFFTTGFAQTYNHNSYVGKEPPELVSRTEHWLGWHEKVTLSDLKGRVVWLQFNF
jgi:hypothetical protein